MRKTWEKLTPVERNDLERDAISTMAEFFAPSIRFVPSVEQPDMDWVFSCFVDIFTDKSHELCNSEEQMLEIARELWKKYVIT